MRVTNNIILIRLKINLLIEEQSNEQLNIPRPKLRIVSIRFMPTLGKILII